MPEKRTAPAINTAEEFEQILGLLDTKKTLAILFDYDGTLAPIAENPNNTFMKSDMELILRKIASNPKIFMGVVSGRGISDVKKRVGITGITYGGNHGIEIEFPDGSRHDYELPDNIKNAYREMAEEMKEKVYKNKAIVEDKRISLTYHYHDTPEDISEKQKQLAIEIIKKHGYTANQAHDAIEAKPPIDWNKGEAANFILTKKFGKNWSEKVNVIFAGDDTTDEDAMRILQGVGKTFRISNDPEIETFADYRLPCQSVVKNLLNWVVTAYQS